MQTIEVRYAQENFNYLIHMMHQGDEYLITENDKPLARILPFTTKISSVSNIKKIKKLRQKNILGMSLATLIHAGRR